MVYEVDHAHLPSWDTLQWMLTGHQTLDIPGLGSHMNVSQWTCGYQCVHCLEGLHLQHHCLDSGDHRNHKVKDCSDGGIPLAIHCCYAMLLVQTLGDDHSKQCGHCQLHFHSAFVAGCWCVSVVLVTKLFLGKNTLSPPSSFNKERPSETVEIHWLLSLLCTQARSQHGVPSKKHD